MTKIQVDFRGRTPRFETERVDIVRSTPEDPDVAEIVRRFQDETKSKMNQVIGETTIPLEGRFKEVRLIVSCVRLPLRRSRGVWHRHPSDTPRV